MPACESCSRADENLRRFAHARCTNSNVFDLICEMIMTARAA
jgi:hypothetical protein